MLLPFAAIIIKLLCRPYCGILPLLISIGKRPKAVFLYYKIVSSLLFCHFDKTTEQMQLRGERTDFNSQSLGRVFGGEEVMAWEVLGTHHSATEGNQRMTNTLLSSLSHSYTV